MKNIKPLGGKSYGSIPHLLGSKIGTADKHIHQGQHDILTKKKRDKHDVIIVTEKYDGSNVAIAKKDNKIFALTRSGYEAHTSPYEQHHKFHAWVTQNSLFFNAALKNGFSLSCELLIKRHSLEYEIDDLYNFPIVAFDLLENKKRTNYDTFLAFMLEATLAKIPLPRVIHKGDCITVEDSLTILNDRELFCMNPIRCLEKPEGVVYRCERKGVFDFCGKFVRHDFEPGKYLDLNK